MTPQSLYRQDAKNTKIIKRIKLGVLCFFAVILALVCLVVLPIWVLASPPAQEQISGNLLVDGDFEAPPTWPQQDGIGEVQVAPGWRAYYLDAPPAYVQVPTNCSDKPRRPDCYWMRPEFRDNVAASFANRVHGGITSQKYFSFGRMHEAGLMQQVRGIPPGARVRFSIWMQAWMCSNPDACGKDGIRSDAPSEMHLRVGIDPLGGTDPFTPTVVWSVEKPAWDEWVLFQVETVALSDTVTVFTHSRAEWDWARLDNDIYLDDASLVIVGAYLTPPAAATLTGTLRAAMPVPTATLLPDGAITYTVQIGDTLFDIALKHSAKVSDLLKLNRITTSTELYVGQPLVVQIVTVTPTPTPRPTEPPPTITASPEPGATATPTGTPLPTLTVTPTLTPTPPVMIARPEFPFWEFAAIGVGFLVVVVGIGVRLVRRR